MRLLSAAIAVTAFLAFFEHLLAADAIPNIDESKYVLPGAKFVAPDWVNRRKGAPFPVKAFLERPIDPSKNAAPLYIYALSRYFSDFDYLYPEEERASYETRTREFQNKISEVIFTEELRSNANTPEITALLNEAAPFFEMIDQAQTRPECIVLTGLEIGLEIPLVQTHRSVAWLSIIQIASACERGDLKSAEHSLQRQLRLLRDFSPRGTIVTQAIAMAINSMMFEAVQQYYLPNKNLSVEDCDRLTKILRQHDKTSPDMYTEGLQADYVIAGNTYDKLETGTLDPKAYPIPIPPTGIINFDLEWEALNQLHEKLLKGSGDFNRMREAVTEVNEDLARMKLKMEESNKSIFGTIGRLIGFTKSSTPVYVPLLFPALTEFSNAIIRNQTRLNALQMVIAVRRYQLAHGKLPNSLDLAAKEAGYEEDLIDPYDGQKLRFVVLNGQPIVYSIGTDRIDQGGKDDWKDGEEPGDFLFPVPQPKTP